MTPDPLPRLDLVVLHSPDVAATRAFYEALGLRFVDERHGDGPAHVAAVLPGGTVVEIYPGPAPSPPTPRLGFTVADPPAVAASLGAPSPTVLTDPDGRRVHLTRPDDPPGDPGT